MELKAGMYIKGEVRRVFTKEKQGSKKDETHFTYKVLCDDRFYNVKSKKNSLIEGDIFFSSVRTQPYDFTDEKTGERKQGSTLWEIDRLEA